MADGDIAKHAGIVGVVRTAKRDQGHVRRRNGKALDLVFHRRRHHRTIGTGVDRGAPEDHQPAPQPGVRHTEVSVEVVEFRREDDGLGRCAGRIDLRAAGDDEGGGATPRAHLGLDHGTGFDGESGVPGDKHVSVEQVGVVSRPGFTG
jgi:hypothetical protein